jgi:hypothetical protein
MVMQSTVNASYEGSIPSDAFQRFTTRLVFILYALLGRVSYTFVPIVYIWLKIVRCVPNMSMNKPLDYTIQSINIKFNRGPLLY